MLLCVSAGRTAMAPVPRYVPRNAGVGGINCQIGGQKQACELTTTALTHSPPNPGKWQNGRKRGKTVGGQGEKELVVREGG